jgi:hypothetical protein
LYLVFCPLWKNLKQFGLVKLFSTAAQMTTVRLTQEEFSARYQIPLGTLRDWEQGRSVPDQTARAYLKVIAGNPEGTAETLAKGGVVAGV